MKAAHMKALLALVLMLAAFAAAQAWRPTLRLADSRPKVELENLFPKAFGDWVVDDRMPVQLVSPDTQAMLNKIYNQILSRTYINSKGDRIMLSVAYGGDQSDATRTHRPEVCYPAQGFQVKSSVETMVGLNDGARLPVRTLVTNLGNRVEPLTYWVVVGDQVVLSGTQQKLAQLRYGMRGVVPDGTLVRVSSIDQDTGRALRLQEQFVKDMAFALDPRWRSFVVGAGGGLT